MLDVTADILFNISYLFFPTSMVYNVLHYHTSFAVEEDKENSLNVFFIKKNVKLCPKISYKYSLHLHKYYNFYRDEYRRFILNNLKTKLKKKYCS